MPNIPQKKRTSRSAAGQNVSERYRRSRSEARNAVPWPRCCKRWPLVMAARWHLASPHLPYLPIACEAALLRLWLRVRGETPIPQQSPIQIQVSDPRDSLVESNHTLLSLWGAHDGEILQDRPASLGCSTAICVQVRSSGCAEADAMCLAWLETDEYSSCPFSPPYQLSKPPAAIVRASMIRKSPAPCLEQPFLKFVHGEIVYRSLSFNRLPQSEC